MRRTTTSFGIGDLRYTHAVHYRNAVVLTVLLASSNAIAEDWTGPDKTRHFVFGTGIGVYGYVAARGLGADESGGALAGFALATVAGVAKESLDALGLGTPSGADLLWSIAGGLVGAGFAWVLDLVTD